MALKHDKHVCITGIGEVSSGGGEEDEKVGKAQPLQALKACLRSLNIFFFPVGHESPLKDL